MHVLLRRTLAALVVFVGPLLGSASVAHAQSWPPVDGPLPLGGGGENDVAVIVGASKYVFLPEVPGAADNAGDWYRYLTTVRGIPASRVSLLVNNDVTNTRIAKALKQAAALATPSSTAWFIYIGHGAPKGDSTDGLMLGVDTQNDIDNFADRGVAQNDALALLGAGPQSTSVAVFDACFSGTTPDNKPLIAQMQATLPTRRAAVPQRSIVLSSSDSFAGPLPGQLRPGYSYLLLGALRGWADVNHDATVTLDEAHQFTVDTMRAALKGSDRLPQMRGASSGVVLARNVTEDRPDVEAIVIGRCPSGARWTGRRCEQVACSAGFRFDGTQCVADRIETVCPPGSALQGGRCVATGAVDCPPGMSFDPAMQRCTVGMQSTVTTSDFNIEVEQALDVATQSENGGSLDTRADAWCKLAGLQNDNRYLERAKQACTAYTQQVDALRRAADALPKEYEKIAKFLELGSRKREEKLAVVDQFLKTFDMDPFRTAQEVLAAREAADAMRAGNSAHLNLDWDGDHLLIDQCPREAEDFDNDHDDDGCLDVTVGDYVGRWTGDTVGAIGETLLFGGFSALPAVAVVGSGDFFLVKDAPLLWGAGLHGSWGATEFGGGGATDLDGRSFVDGYAGLQVFELPRLPGFGLLKPSGGVHALWTGGYSSSSSGYLASWYVANTSRFGPARLRIAYRSGLDVGPGIPAATNPDKSDASAHPALLAKQGAISVELGGDIGGVLGGLDDAFDGNLLLAKEYDDSDRFYIGMGGGAFYSFTANAPFVLSMEARSSWGMAEVGLGMAAPSDFNRFLGTAYAGLQLFELPGDEEFSLVRPSIGLRYFGALEATDSSAQAPAGNLLQVYVANTLRLGVFLQARVAYHYGVLGGIEPLVDTTNGLPRKAFGGMVPGEHSIGVDLTFNPRAVD